MSRDYSLHMWPVCLRINICIFMKLNKFIFEFIIMRFFRLLRSDLTFRLNCAVQQKNRRKYQNRTKVSNQTKLCKPNESILTERKYAN